MVLSKGVGTRIECREATKSTKITNEDNHQEDLLARSKVGERKEVRLFFWGLGLGKTCNRDFETQDEQFYAGSEPV